MGLNSVNFNVNQGGLGRARSGEDHISGYQQVYLNANLPSGFLTTDRIKKVFSLEEAEALGIIKGAANQDIAHYHISEAYRKNPELVLFIHLIDSTAIDLAADAKTLQDFAEGTIRQIAFYNTAVFVTAALTTIQGGLDILAAEDQPISSFLYAADMQALTLAALTDLTLLSNKNVSVVLGEDGGGRGAALALSEAQSITTLGATLGVVSDAKVNQNIGWVQEFPMSDGTELEVAAFATGAALVLFKDQATALLDTLNDFGYIFLRKFIGLTGTFHNDSHTAVAETSDFSKIENNRTMDKAIRNVRINMLPQLNSPLLVNEDGTLTEDVIAKFKGLAEDELIAMITDEELSAQQVIIDPEQNVLSTSKIVLTLKLIPVGVAREIEINIGFAVSVTT